VMRKLVLWIGISIVMASGSGHTSP